MNDKEKQQFDSLKQEVSLFQLNELKRNDEVKQKIVSLITTLNETNERITQLSKQFYDQKDYVFNTFQRFNQDIKDLKSIPKKEVRNWRDIFKK